MLGEEMGGLVRKYPESHPLSMITFEVMFRIVFYWVLVGSCNKEEALVGSFSEYCENCRL